jgi:dTDP-4-dehydrorhamnose 3,5-epimerase
MSKSWFDIQYLADAGPALIHTVEATDKRGSFSRLFCSNELQKALSFNNLIQANLSVSTQRGTVRGLHFQKKPFEDAKILRCLSGSINDYLVDLRSDSAHLGKVYKINLSDRYDIAIFIPKGFAHGFQTLQDDTKLMYFHDEVYNADSEAGISIFSPDLSIELDLPVSSISNRDQMFPMYES